MKFSKIIYLTIISLLAINCKKDDDPVIDIPVEVTENSTAENAPPTSPLLVLPEMNSNLNSLAPTLHWNASTDPENETIQYEVFLGTNESSMAILVSNLETTEFEITANLEKGTTYYWKVAAKDIKGNSTSSELFNFSTEHIAVNLVTQEAAFSKRNFSTTTVFKDKIWIIGGKDEGNTVLSDIWSSSDGANWNLETDAAPFGAIKGHAVIVFNDKMWIYSGSNGVLLNYKIWSTEDGINWVEETNDSTWNTVPFYSQSATTMFVFDNKIWRFAAYDSSTGDLTTERNIWNSSDGKNWTLVNENHGFNSKFGMEVIPFQGKLIGIEGSTGSNQFSKIWQSTNGIDWEVIAEDLPFSFSWYCEAQILDDKLYMTAGYGYSELWFTEDGISWKKAVQEREYPSRYANSSVIFNDKIYVIGGGTHTDKYNDVWTLE